MAKIETFKTCDEMCSLMNTGYEYVCCFECKAELRHKRLTGKSIICATPCKHKKTGNVGEENYKNCIGLDQKGIPEKNKE